MDIAIITARGGSKRIPRKNIKKFAGKELISYSILTAQESGVFDKIIVSTEDSEISKVALKYNADVPFRRPDNLANDFTPTIKVLLHAIEWYKENNINIDNFCCIYPNPFITAENINKGFSLLTKTNVSSVIPVTTFSSSIQRSFKINKKGFLEFSFPENALKRTQDLYEFYHDVGQFYWCNCEKFLSSKKILNDDTLPLIIPRHLSQDIDTIEDWEFAEKLYKTFMQ